MEIIEAAVNFIASIIEFISSTELPFFFWVFMTIISAIFVWKILKLLFPDD